MHPVISKTSKLILSGEIASAERALVEIAESDGDHALVKVLDEIPAKDLVSILREFDSSKESVINLLVTPEQFARAVVEETKFGERTFERLHGMVNSVIHNDRDMAEEFLGELVETAEGCSALSDYFEDYLEQFFTFALWGTFAPEEYPDLPEGVSYLSWLMRQIQGRERDLYGTSDEEAPTPVLQRAEIADGAWMETAWVLRYQVPDGFGAIFNMLQSRVLKRMEAETAASRAKQNALAEGLVDSDNEESAI